MILTGIFFRFVGSARQLAKALEVPLVNDLGYTKRYVRCLQVMFDINIGLCAGMTSMVFLSIENFSFS